MPTKRYIKLILPLRLEWEPCYLLAGDVRPGQRVIVRFAGRRTVGVVSEVDVTPDIDESRIQPVLTVESGLEPISPEEISLWRFIADYYLCTVGEVYKAAYPGLKTAAEESSARSQQRKEAMEERTIEVWQQRIARLEARLQAKEADLSKKHNDAVRSRLESQRGAILEELQAAKDRLASFSHKLDLAGQDWSRLLKSLPETAAEPILAKALSSGKPVLLKSSDRIQNYVQAAAEQIRKGKNVCILVNEIALAGKLCEALRASFGELVLVHHSQMTRAAQRRINDAVRSGRPYVLVGTRSAIFIPHRELGLIIVENEESPFYKQSDTAPRYNARDCAVQLARIHGCGIILGSASPSLESILNARSGRYSLIDRNPDGREMHPGCSFTLIDIPAERKKNGMAGVFSRKLLEAMRWSKRSALIRGFEKPEELGEPQADVFTFPQAAKTDLSSYDLVGILNADALFNPADFRSDEHAFQFLERLKSICPKLMVQTRQAGHQVFALNSAEPLLEERRAFNLPPYYRLIELRVRDAATAESLGRSLQKDGFSPMVLAEAVRIALPRDKQLLERKRKIRKTVEAFRSTFKADVIIDVDPA